MRREKERHKKRKCSSQILPLNKRNVKNLLFHVVRWFLFLLLFFLFSKIPPKRRPNKERLLAFEFFCGCAYEKCCTGKKVLWIDLFFFLVCVRAKDCIVRSGHQLYDSDGEGLAMVRVDLGGCSLRHRTRRHLDRTKH